MNDIKIIGKQGISGVIERLKRVVFSSNRASNSCTKGMIFDVIKHIDNASGEITYYIYALSKSPKGYLKGTRIMGHVTVKYYSDKNEGYILNLRSHIQGVGVGTMIMNRLIELKESENMDLMWGKISLNAIGFYEKIDFVKISKDKRKFKFK